MKLLKTLSILSVFAIFSCNDTDKKTETSNADTVDFKIDYEKFTLDNGLLLS